MKRRTFLALTPFIPACSGALRGGVLMPTHTTEEVVPVPPPVIYDGHIHDFGFWLDSSPDTTQFSTVVTHYIDFDESPAQWASLLRTDEKRRIIWSPTFFSYGPTPRSRNGYTLRPDYVEKWTLLKELISNHLDRSLAVWGPDEPDSVAFGDMPSTGYDPNLYNGEIDTIAKMVKADFPSLSIGLNYGSAPAGLAIPSSVDIVGVEAYGVDWLAKLNSLKVLTNAKFYLMPATFSDFGQYAITDELLAERLLRQYTYAKTDTRVNGLYCFTYCCDDLVTGNKAFRSISGGGLPLTLDRARRIGMEIKG